MEISRVNKRFAAGLGAGIALIVLAAAWFIWRDPTGLFDPAVKFAKEGDLLVISGKKYEIAFSAADGGIRYVRGESRDGSRETISLGNRAGALWWSFADDASSSWNGAGQTNDFTYQWHRRGQSLVLRYGGPMQVEATFAFGADGRVEMQANVVNRTASALSSFQFPYELKADAARVQDGLLPLLPGARLTAAFFRESNSYEAQYPGTMFASYSALRTSGGNLAMYDVHGRTVETTKLGFKNQVDDAGKTALVHGYDVAIPPDGEWSTPKIVLEIGGDYPDSIRGYGERNGFADMPTLAEKLGSELPAYAAMPFYKMDISALKDASWQRLKTDYVDRMNSPGVLHLVGFQRGGHDENYPDFLPPDPVWGSESDFQAFVRGAREKGNKVVPYTNFSWWGVQAPTLAELPDGTALEDIAAVQKNGLPIKEDYGPHSGYVMNPAHPFVRERIAREHGKLLDEAGFDGIFEDQWGIRDAPAIYNEVLPDGTHSENAYFQGVRDYFKASSGMKLYTEDGIDVLAGDAVGFMGTNYLWDLLGYRKNTAAYTEYYPMIGMLLRDKVMLYQHDLAAETMTDNQDMLRWNLAMGYSLSVDLYNGVSNPWVNAAGVFQREVLARYADAPVTGFEQAGPGATRTVFGSKHAVTANWSPEEPYVLDESTTLSPGGFDVRSEDGSVRAGNYSRYNGFDLDPGEHDLVEVRGEKAIRVYQPIGADTTLRVRKGDGWKHAVATAYEADGTKIADWPVEEDGEYARFDYIALAGERKVGFVELTASDEPSAVAPGAYRKAKLRTNLAIGREIRSTTDTAEAFAAEKAVDGDPYTYWESISRKFPQSLTVDLGEAAEVDRLVLRLVPQDAWERREQTIEVLGSADGETFETLLDERAYAFDPAAENVAEIPLAAAAKVRYIRLTVSDNTAWPAAQISEFEVYGGP